MKEEISNHIVTIENNRKIMLTGIVEVVSATDKTIIAKTQNKTLNINGYNLRVSKLNPEENLLIIEGEINELKYIVKAKSKNFFKRIFS